MFGRRGLLAAVLPFVLFQVVSAVPTSGQPQAVKRAAPHEVVALLKRAPVNPSDPGESRIFHDRNGADDG